MLMGYGFQIFFNSVAIKKAVRNFLKFTLKYWIDSARLIYIKQIEQFFIFVALVEKMMNHDIWLFY